MERKYVLEYLLSKVKDYFCLGGDERLMDVLIDFKYILSGFFWLSHFVDPNYHSVNHGVDR